MSSKRKRRLATKCKRTLKVSVVAIVVWRVIEFAANMIDISQVSHYFGF